MEWDAKQLTKVEGEQLFGANNWSLFKIWLEIDHKVLRIYNFFTKSSWDSELILLEWAPEQKLSKFGGQFLKSYRFNEETAIAKVSQMFHKIPLVFFVLKSDFGPLVTELIITTVILAIFGRIWCFLNNFITYKRLKNFQLQFSSAESHT